MSTESKHTPTDDERAAIRAGARSEMAHEAMILCLKAARDHCDKNGKSTGTSHAMLDLMDAIEARAKAAP